MPYTTPTPSTVSAGDTFPASAYNIISADLQDHESRIKTGVESYTTAQKNALTGVATGTMVYDSTLGVFQSYTGSAWVNAQGSPPILTTAQKTALGTPATGTMVYDSTLGLLQMWNGSSWTSSIPYTQRVGYVTNTTTAQTITSVPVTLFGSNISVTTSGSTTYKLQFFCPIVNVPASASVYLTFKLYDGANFLGQLAYISSGAATFLPVNVTMFWTPAAGTYALNVQAASQNASSSLQTNSGFTPIFFEVLV